MPEMQTIPARHGVATFVPAGQTIKIVNTSGSQVVDTWAFALPHPDVKNGEDQKQGQQEPPKKEELSQQSQKEERKEDEKPAPTPNKKNRGRVVWTCLRRRRPRKLPRKVLRMEMASNNSSSSQRRVLGAHTCPLCLR